ncbi:putative 26S proteasome regulatory subunit p27 [Meyerozyma sp. JA9]|nr:putative 26S proteasome regulatory subunit p27 [Meyerozyma sp. JA9]
MTTDFDGFAGVMRTLNLDPDKFPSYSGDFNALNYRQLAAVKSDIETQLSALFDMLTNNFAADMSTPLVTEDGFPRNDIDVVSIRLVRVRIVMLKNDLKAVLELLEEKLQQQFSGPTQSAPAPVAAPVPVEQLVPFAVVTEMADESPAKKAGLQLHDKIVYFDDINAANHNRLQAIAGHLRSRQDQEVQVLVLREGEKVRLQLVPSDNWSGNGLLGCRLVPL